MHTNDSTRDPAALPQGGRGARNRAPLHAALALQRAAGNRNVGQLLRRKPPGKRPAHAVDNETPTGVTAGADPLPSGANLAGAAGKRVVDDSGLEGGWTERGGRKISSGRVGAIDRILLEGIRGSQDEQGELSNLGVPGADQYARAVGPGKRGQRGRAVALVPHAMRTGGGGETAVVVHFHGLDMSSSVLGSAGMRRRDGRPEDVEHFQIPQQVEQYLASRPGARVVVLMPIGITTQGERGRNSAFGLGKMDDFVADCFGRLRGGPLPKDAKPGPVYLSAHSGGGFEIERMIAKPERLPKRFGGVFGFESIHGGDHASTWTKLAREQLEKDLLELELRKGDGAAQLAYLRSSFRFAAFGGTRSYKAHVRAVRKGILDWFADARTQRRLQAATGGRADVLNQLWSNYQAQTFERSTHMNALSQNANFGRVLASLPPVGPLAGAAPAAPAPAAPAPAPPAAPEREHALDTPSKRNGGVAPKKKRVSKKLEPVSSSGFTPEHYQMSEKAYAVTKGSKIFRPVTESTAEILRLAGEDPDTWYDNFTSGRSFLGANIRDPIHIKLAEHLGKVEAELAREYGGGDPAEAGRKLGVDEEIIGARDHPTSASISMHMFGLAIDVNYTANPFVSASANDIFGRAGELVHGRKAAWKSRMSYAQLSELDKTLEDYFALLDDPAALKAKLRDATGAWKDMGGDVEQAKRQIEHDLSGPVVREKRGRKSVVVDRGGVGARWNRGSGKQLAVIRKGGIMDLPPELVRGLKLDWGASYGDNMHFDMRNTPLGKKILAAIRTYQGSAR
jgi:hypothetical protein